MHFMLASLPGALSNAPILIQVAVPRLDRATKIALAPKSNVARM